MARGRPPKGPDLVEGVDASALAKERLKVILQSVAGSLSVADACAQLNVGEARFHELRAEVLGSAARTLEPKPPGRPPQVPTEEQKRIVELERQITDLKVDLRAAQLREQIALVAPHLLQPQPGENDNKKKH
jgi:hypothetical protein